MTTTMTAPNKALRRKVKVEFHDDNNGTIAQVEVPERTLITEAATQAGLKIPTLCHHPRLAPAGRCGLCVCSVEDGPTPTQLACSTYVKATDNHDDDSEIYDSSTEEDGTAIDAEATSHDCPGLGQMSLPDMVIHVNGKDLNDLSNAALKRNMDRAMAYRNYPHQNQFATCGTLEIEDLGNLMKHKVIDTSSAAITYDPSLCVGCSRCMRACDQLQGMNVLDLPIPDAQPSMGIAQAPPCMTTRDGRPLRDTDCISCGQCAVFCPTGAIKEVDHTARVMRALLDPDMVVVLQTAPSTRVGISEMFGGAPGECYEQQLVGAAKASGFDFVFDTNMAADLTIMEEAHELLQRIEIDLHGTDQEREQKPLPMFTSCCPGWINLVEQSYPHLIPHLSTCRSPMGMLSSMIRQHWWSQQEQARKKALGEVDQSNLFVVAVMPCTAKKDEIARPQLRLPDGTPETNAVLTVREFARLLELRNVAQRTDPDSFACLKKATYDNPFGDATGAAAIFGVTGGVAEAALRTAADVLSGQSLQDVTYQAVRGLLGIKKATVHLDQSTQNASSSSIDLKVAVCNQMINVRQFLAQIENGNQEEYHFVEIMTCPGGCIGGGGMPQSRDPDIISKRVEGLYSLDERKVKRKSHENEDVQQVYKEILGSPLSDISHKMLHTHYASRRRKPHPRRRVGRKNSVDSSSFHTETTVGIKRRITIVYGTLSGTSKRAANQIKTEVKKCVERSGVEAETKVSVVAGNADAPEKIMRKLRRSFLSIIVTPTYDHADGCCFPDQLCKFWEYLKTCDKEGIDSMTFAVFGLGSTMYSGFEEEFFNRAAKTLDRTLAELGGQRLIPLGLADDMDERNYRDGLDSWLEKLGPAVVQLLNEETRIKEVPGVPPVPPMKGSSGTQSIPTHFSVHSTGCTTTDSGSSHSVDDGTKSGDEEKAPKAKPPKGKTAMFFM